MNRMMSKSALMMAAVACMSLAGCKSGAEKAADKNLTDLKDANKHTATTSVGKTSLPPECDAYVTKVDACVKSLGSNNQMAGSFKQAMETARASWANIPDKTALANSCKQADAMFSQNAAAMGCK